MASYWLPAVLFILITLEGSGIKYGRDFSPFLILLFALIFVALNVKSVKLAPSFFRLSMLFFALTTLSVVFSQNILNSLLYYFVYIACFLIFIIVSNKKNSFERLITPLILALGIIFCLYSVFFPTLQSLSSLFKPSTGYQIVFSFFGSHNHLGDFLILPIIICVWRLFSNKNRGFSAINYFLLALFYLPFFLFSFSRSAYVALLLTIILMVVALMKKGSIRINASSAGLLVFVILAVVLFFTGVTGNLNQVKPIKNMSSILYRQNDLSYKFPYGNRPEFLREAWASILEKPVFGVGPGNFVLSSKKYGQAGYGWTETAHNIFIDIIVENGIFAGIVFVLIIFEIFRRSDRNLYFYLALGLLFNFQTDYLYRIHSLLFLFFILAGLTYSSKPTGNSS